jgi:hypothetical protein
LIDQVAASQKHKSKHRDDSAGAQKMWAQSVLRRSSPHGIFDFPVRLLFFPAPDHFAGSPVLSVNLLMTGTHVTN